MKRQIVIYILSFVLCPLSLWAQTTEMEKRYNQLSERFTNRDKLLPRDLKAYMQAYPYTTFADEVMFMQGAMQVEKGHYKQGLKILEQVDMSALSREHQNDYSFLRGYAYLMQQDYQRATIYFGILSKHDSRYKIRALYYNAYCLYKLERYDDALPALQQLESYLEYSKTVPYYLVQIYYAKGNYDEVETRANTILREQPDSPNRGELHRMLGEINYLRGDYQAAVDNLRQYEALFKEQGQDLLREDLFLLGQAEYKLGHYQEAVRYLKQVKQEQDTLSEATCLTMGNAYVKAGEPEQAKLWYRAAANYGLTPAITEEASYNYTLCTYESSSALGESVRAFREFLNTFPDSKYEADVYRLLGDALMRSKNYAEALKTLDAIPVAQNAKLLATKQYLRYQLAADCFLQGKMPDAINWATEVINHSDDDSKYTAEAYYIRAEANYRLHAYLACEQDLVRFFARPEAKRSDNYNIARYLQGYCYFSQSDYERAKTAFQTYIDGSLATEATYADALNRIGDCYFNSREFRQAIAYYTQVSNLQAAGADYALFQRGYALGLQHNYSEKISVLRSLISIYPKSDYADDAVYETARAQLQIEDERGAIVTYEQLLSKYPHSTLARRSSLERAMLYRNLQQNDEAIAAYRQTIERYPATEEAYTALDALQALYVEQGRVDEYLSYTKGLVKVNMNVTTQEDSLLFAAAEMQYMQAAYQKATVSLNNYITQYCAGGRYCTTARYFLADSYYRLGQTTEALAQYRQLAEQATNPYQEEATMRVAEISYDKQDYKTALEAFYRMNALASSRENTDIARLGILRCSRELGRHQATIDIAEQILGDQPVSDAMRQEALYSRAKANIANGAWEKAEPDLRTLSQEVRTAQGAESKYLLAESYFRQGLIDDAESEVMSFTHMNTQQQYWLARALILLSDISLKRGENFQARQYLLVLQQNYTAQGDDIPSLISTRIAALDELDKPVIMEENEDEE